MMKHSLSLDKSIPVGRVSGDLRVAGLLLMYYLGGVLCIYLFSSLSGVREYVCRNNLYSGTGG